MVALVIVCIVLITIALFMVPSKGFLLYSPTIFPGLISILIQSWQLLAQLRYAGASDAEHLVQFFKRSRFQLGLAYNPTFKKNRFCVINVDYSQNKRSN